MVSGSVMTERTPTSGPADARARDPTDLLDSQQDIPADVV